MKFLEGYKTWIGILVTIMGALGISQLVGEENVSKLADAIIEVIGIIITIYGNYMSHKKVAKKK